jgi:hypothetical protein
MSADSFRFSQSNVGYISTFDCQNAGLWGRRRTNEH